MSHESFGRGMGGGIYMEWTDADLAAQQAQQASMDAQRTASESGTTWQEVTPEQRIILTEHALKNLSYEDTVAALNTLDQNQR